ncbi:hypothetical protein [Micromonospora sp. IBHARD004]|uniref:hypothetical protein n=1 Tax=Micromonospora sp. IBHARD004 TaxID=3457764 RepID=UPI0040592A03
MWRTAFGGRLDYDLRADLDGQDVPVSFTELFYPDSGDYHDLWGWIEHECGLAEEHQPDWSGPLVHLPIGGFEYLERVYVHTAAGPDHGAVVCWRQGLPPGWELRAGDRAGRLADDLGALFGQLVLEQDPWGNSGDPHARSAAAKLRRLVRATVLDWRRALDPGTLVTQRRLGRLALDRAAANDDVALLARLVALGCDPTEEVRNGLTAIDVALLHRANAVVQWLLERRVPVENSLQVAAHAVDLDLARDLLHQGARINTCVVSRALDNEDVEVVRLPVAWRAAGRGAWPAWAAAAHDGHPGRARQPPRDGTNPTRRPPSVSSAGPQRWRNSPTDSTPNAGPDHANRVRKCRETRATHCAPARVPRRPSTAEPDMPPCW